MKGNVKEARGLDTVTDPEENTRTREKPAQSSDCLKSPFSHAKVWLPLRQFLLYVYKYFSWEEG